MAVTQRLLSNASYLSADWVLNVISSAVFWIVAAKFILPADYGVTATSINLMMILFTLSNLGLTASASVIVPKIVKRYGSSSAGAVSRNMMLIALFVPMILALPVFLFSGQISAAVKMPSDAVMLVLPALIAVSLNSVSGGILMGFQNFKRYFYTDFLTATLKIAMPLLFLTMFRDYRAFLLGFAVAYLLPVVFRLKWEFFTMERFFYLRGMLSYAASSMVASLAMAAMLYGQNIILSAAKGALETGLFALAFTFSSLVYAFSGVITGAITPVVSELAVSRASEKARSVLMLSVRYFVLLALPIVAFVAGSPIAFILFVAKPGYLSSAPIIEVLMPAMVIMGAASIIFSCIFAAGKTGPQRTAYPVAASVFLVAAYYLANKYAGLGMAMSYLITTVILLAAAMYYSGKLLKTQPFEKGLVKPVISAVAMYVAMSVLSKSYINSIVSTFAMGFIGVCAYFAVLYFAKFFDKRDEAVVLAIAEHASRVFKRSGRAA
jgi:O-antigen/teichoic acid export membrane protein